MNEQDGKNRRETVTLIRRQNREDFALKHCERCMVISVPSWSHPWNCWWLDFDPAVFGLFGDKIAERC